MEADTPIVVVEFQNTSSSPVAAYAIRLVGRGEDGQVISARTHSAATRGLGMSFRRTSFQPGQRWSEAVPAPEGEPLQVQLDLVMFEDGMFWGPNRSRQLERLLGMTDGARFEREVTTRRQ